MVEEFTNRVIEDIKRTGRSITEYLDRRRRHDFRGRIIQWFCEHPDSKSVVQGARDQIEAVRTQESLCCLNRLILTFIMAARANIRTEFPVTAHEIAVEVGRVLGLESGDIDRAVLHLFHGGGRKKGEFVEIYQQEPTTKDPASLQPSAVVEITERGKGLVEYFLLALDYWGYLAYSPAPAPLLFELGPTAAVHYMRRILAYVQEIANAHAKAWIDRIGLSMPCDDHAKPFRYYAREFIIRDVFYLQRVAASHRTTIHDYAYETLRGKDTGVMMSRDDSEQFTKEWTAPNGLCPQPKQFRRYITASRETLYEGARWLDKHAVGGRKVGDLVRELLRIDHEYVRVDAGFIVLAAMTKRQLRETSWQKFARQYFVESRAVGGTHR